MRCIWFRWQVLFPLLGSKSVPFVGCHRLNSVLFKVLLMTDWGTSPAFSLHRGSIAELFYEMHTLCENELDLSLREKNLVSLGYLLYSSPDAILLITTLKWVNPTLILEVHKLMLKVCHEALACLVDRKCLITKETLSDYDSVMRLIREKSKYLEASLG